MRHKRGKHCLVLRFMKISIPVVETRQDTLHYKLQDSTMAIVVAKVVSMLCLGAVTWVVGVLPLLGVRKGWLKESQQTQTMVNLFSALTCFGGGVILTSCLTHMLPDVNEVVVLAIEQGSFPDSGLPVAEIFVLAGFLMIYMLEEVLHHILVKSGHLKEEEGAHSKPGGHGHSHGSVITSEEGLQVDLSSSFKEKYNSCDFRRQPAVSLLFLLSLSMICSKESHLVLLEESLQSGSYF